MPQDSHRLHNPGLSRPLHSVPTQQKQLAAARNEGKHADHSRPAQHPHLAALAGVVASAPTALLILGSITQLRNTKINQCAPPPPPPPLVI